MGRGTKVPPSTFLVTPQATLFMTINLHCPLHNMERDPQASVPEEDEVIYYVNMDYAGWVEQLVRRRVYVELKLERIRNRSWDVYKAMDDWLCLYYRGYFSNKLQLTYHHVGGCPCGPVDLNDSRWKFHVYPNLKTTKQGKDLKNI
jgi:hypothetical protein